MAGFKQFKNTDLFLTILNVYLSRKGTVIFALAVPNFELEMKLFL